MDDERRSDGLADDMIRVLALQKAAQQAQGIPDVEIRAGRLDRAIALLVDHADDFAAALRADFGHRSVQASLLSDIAASLGSLRHARANLAHWMKRERRKVTPHLLGWLGAKAWVDPLPKGVVGLISPWNFPVNLTFGPLAGILAAGNRAMIKPSEFTPETSALTARLVGEAFDESEIAVFPGGPELGAAFAALPFDHLLFTGSTSIGRKVARAAAENLVPVTLELGGKSPVVLGEDADMALAATRIMAGKTLNAGQVCLAPDYVLVPRQSLSAFVAAARAAVAKMYPRLKDNDDYSSLISARHHERLRGYLQEARQAGAAVIPLSDEDFSQQPFHKMPPTLVLEPDDNLALMQDEIFGPILPVQSYDRLEEAIARIHARPRPLAAYFFGRQGREQFLGGVVSGSVAIDDVVMQYAMEDLPFGGIGPSGMGAYHGVEGFRTFSHARAVFVQSRRDLTAVARPPYGGAMARLLKGSIRK